MYYTLYLKFDQNPDLKKMLMDTGDDMIVFANGYLEMYWGNGVYIGNASDLKDISKWEGKNRLGHLLEDLREKFKNDS